MTKFTPATLAGVVAAAITAYASVPMGSKQSSADTVYPVSMAEALKRLDDADVIGFRDARQCGLLLHIRNYEEDHYSTTFVVRSSNREVARFTVALKPTAKGIQTSIVVPKHDNGREMYDGTQYYSHPALMQPLRPAVRELIDAAMARRPFDSARLPDPLAMWPQGFNDNCNLGQQYLSRGYPVNFDDPAGIPHPDLMQPKLQ
jgi:hypothetical protein